MSFSLPLSIELAQLNPIVGKLNTNFENILKAWKNASSDLVVFSELVTCGYPPEDLILKPSFIDAIHQHIASLLNHSRTLESAIILATPWREDGKTYNAALLLHKGKIIGKTFKHHLPNYGVFDEKRIFDAGTLPRPVEFKGQKLGILICEDMWKQDVAMHLKTHGADILIIPNGSPYETGKLEQRVRLARERVQETQLPLIYVNQVGGQDELVFDGGSFVLDNQGTISQQLPFFREAQENAENKSFKEWSIEQYHDHIKDKHVYAALTLGIRDYVSKNGFSSVLIGLSGGIDSALTAVLAVDALGKENVHCVMLPSEFTSRESLEDAQMIVDNLGVSYETFPIVEPLKSYENLIPDLDGLAHENIQSRIRGSILMALSNARGSMLLTTGNKSEIAVGYATLYGDMNGGFNALKDLYKTQVYLFSNWRNQNKPEIGLGPSGPVIPQNVITRAPSAELRADQTDQDSLPDYEVLDGILHGLVEEEQSIENLSKDYNQETVEKIYKLLNIAEYKRYQAPPGTKITSKAFGRDRRYPMTNGFKG